MYLVSAHKTSCVFAFIERNAFSHSVCFRKSQVPSIHDHPDGLQVFCFRTAGDHRMVRGGTGFCNECAWCEPHIVRNAFPFPAQARRRFAEMPRSADPEIQPPTAVQHRCSSAAVRRVLRVSSQGDSVQNAFRVPSSISIRIMISLGKSRITTSNWR